MFYPILNDILFFYQSKQESHPRYQYGTENSGVCERFKSSDKSLMTMKKEEYSSELNFHCLQRKFYCVNLLTGVQTGPWVCY